MCVWHAYVPALGQWEFIGLLPHNAYALLHTSVLFSQVLEDKSSLEADISRIVVRVDQGFLVGSVYEG